jgi:hypothetical protein
MMGNWILGTSIDVDFFAVAAASSRVRHSCWLLSTQVSRRLSDTVATQQFTTGCVFFFTTVVVGQLKEISRSKLLLFCVTITNGSAEIDRLSVEMRFFD